MVEVFKTNVNKMQEAEFVISTLLVYLPERKINFDLEDPDKILRIEDGSGSIDRSLVIAILKYHDFDCEILKD